MNMDENLQCLDAKLFQKHFDEFTPVIDEGTMYGKANNKMQKEAFADAKATVKRMTSKEALAFLDELVDKMNQPESLYEMVHQSPTGCLSRLTQYDASRLNWDLDILLLEVVEAFHKNIHVMTTDRKNAYEALQSKLRIIHRMREDMWLYNQILQGIIPGAQLYDCDQGKECMQALMRVLLHVRSRNYHKRQNMVCEEAITPEGMCTGYFEPKKTVEQLVYELANMHTHKELFQLLFASGEANINTIINHLTKNDSLLEFPVIKAARGWYSFNNGVYDVSGDRFWPYGTSKPEVCTVHYIKEDFVTSGEGDWRNIRTPAIDKILSTQQLSPEVQEWLWILLGRTLFQVKELDRWEVIPYIQGVSDSGKSTLVDGLYRYLFDQASTFVLSNNLEQQFGLQDALGPSSPFMICCGSEIGKDFKLDQKQFQQMCSGERLSVAVKNGKAVQDVWTLPMIMSGNQAPSYCDDSGSIARRLAIFRFTVPLSTEQKDPLLFHKMGREMPQILQKMARAYKERVDNGDVKRDFWKVAGQAFAESRAELKAATNPLEDFAQSGILDFRPENYMKLADLKESAKSFARAKDHRLPALSTDSLTDVFKPRGVYFETKAKRMLPGTNQRCVTAWAVGVAKASANDVEMEEL